MREHSRKNLQDLFVGDPDPLSEGANADQDSPEAVEFKVKSGRIWAQVPHGTQTESIFGPDRWYQAELVLDDDTRISVTISQGAEGVDITRHRNSPEIPRPQFPAP